MKSLMLLSLMILFTVTSSLAYSIQDENSILVDQHVLIVADVTSALETPQPFTYFVQIQDDTGAVVSLGWLSGTLSPKQMLSPALSWTPQYPGTYRTTVFVWEGIDSPSALSPSIFIDIDVRQAKA